MSLLWVALACFFFAVAVGLVVLTVRALALFRDLKRLRRELTASLEQIARSTAKIERRADSLAERSAELERRADGLSTTLERASILAAALRDVRDAVGRLGSVVPRK